MKADKQKRPSGPLGLLVNKTETGGDLSLPKQADRAGHEFNAVNNGPAGPGRAGPGGFRMSGRADLWYAICIN